MQYKYAELRPVTTRLPEALRQRLEKKAAQNGRSMNGEIIHRLQLSFEKDGLKMLAVETAKATVRLIQGQNPMAQVPTGMTLNTNYDHLTGS